MNCKDNIEWLKSLKQQIGQSQHSDLWHFEQVIDETIANLEPLAKPHGRLIDADRLFAIVEQTEGLGTLDNENDVALSAVEVLSIIDQVPTVIETEVNE